MQVFKQSVKIQKKVRMFKGVFRDVLDFNSELRLCSQCDSILEYCYNAKGFLCLACVNCNCWMFKHFLKISKPEFIALIVMGVAIRRGRYV